MTQPQDFGSSPAPAPTPGDPSPPAGYGQAPPPPAGYGSAAHGPVGKPRRPAAVIIFSIITLGIYWLVYVFKTSKEIKNHSGLGVGPGITLVITIFVGIVTPFLLANDVGAVRRHAGVEPRVSAVTGLWMILPLIGLIVWCIKVQGALNDYWQSQGSVR